MEPTRFSGTLAVARALRHAGDLSSSVTLILATAGGATTDRVERQLLAQMAQESARLRDQLLALAADHRDRASRQGA